MVPVHRQVCTYVDQMWTRIRGQYEYGMWSFPDSKRLKSLLVSSWWEWMFIFRASILTELSSIICIGEDKWLYYLLLFALEKTRKEWKNKWRRSGFYYSLTWFLAKKFQQLDKVYYWRVDFELRDKVDKIIFCLVSIDFTYENVHDNYQIV